MISLPTPNFTTSLKSYKISNILPLVLINFYKYTFSYFLGGRCRFYPSCSEYALECYGKFNFIKSSQLVLLRLIKCHPFSGRSGYDPAPFINGINESKKI
ncbi:MAG: membrane protein insertion efficiency factor YidD [Moraxellaceae bacterium]|nr:membrane protein insertion efficiency factor YidD [Pseudobdellovibrionaceae bacterium]